MRKAIGITLLAAAALTLAAEVRAETADERPYWRRNLFKRLAGDQKYLFTTWAREEVKNPWFSGPLLVAVAGATGSSANGMDLTLQREIARDTVGQSHGMAEAFSQLGNTETGVLFLGTSFLIAKFSHNERLMRTTSLSTEALINAGVYTSLLKRATRRTRPAADGLGQFFVESPQNGQESTSFPSGHASGAFAMATVFAAEYRHKKWVPWVAYGTAGMIALSRVQLGRHFPSDVIAGAMIGNSMGRMVLRRNGELPVQRDWRVEPIFEPRGGGVGLAYSRSW